MKESLFKKIFCVLVFINVTTVDVRTFECGTTDFEEGLIVEGTRTHRGEWPFLTALYQVEPFSFLCGGTLISAKHVLTAAHCIQEKDSDYELLAVDVVVLLGAYDLTLTNEPEVQTRYVSDIHVHKDWDVWEGIYDADLAILSLNETVLFTDYIRHVCIPEDNIGIDGARGSVPGWGWTETRAELNLEYIKQANVTVLNDTYCYTKDPNISAFSSKRTFCGKSEDGSPNEGDSGGGLYVRSNSGSSWVLYGTVSIFIKDATGYVDPNSIMVYTNVILFKSWIAEIVTASGGAIEEAIIMVNIKVELTCSYDYDSQTNSYGCWIYNLDSTGANFEVDWMTGFHDYLKTDHDVKKIEFHNGTMFFLPSEIGKFFRNLTHFEINEGLNTKSIRRSQLKNLENLLVLKIFKNDIDTLDKYALRDLPNLENFVLQRNNLREIHGKTFEKNRKLKLISLISNQLTVLPMNLFKNNSILEIVNLGHNLLKVIDESIFAANDKIRIIDLSWNELETLPKDLLKNNPLLDDVDISHNSLKVIDESIFATNGNLRLVDLSSNVLKALPRKLFENNPLLKSVVLDHNYLKVIDENIFATNRQLNLINLDSNQLKALPRKLFENNLLLQGVSFSKNFIKVIDGNTFETNEKLEIIDLASNIIQVLPSKLFQNNLLLQNVDFRNNFLNLIAIDFIKFKNIRKIDFYNNVCIDAYYEDSYEDRCGYYNIIKNLTEFQNLIRVNCKTGYYITLYED